MQIGLWTLDSGGDDIPAALAIHRLIELFQQALTALADLATVRTALLKIVALPNLILVYRISPQSTQKNCEAKI